MPSDSKQHKSFDVHPVFFGDASVIEEAATHSPSKKRHASTPSSVDVIELRSQGSLEILGGPGAWKHLFELVETYNRPVRDSHSKS